MDEEPFDSYHEHTLKAAFEKGEYPHESKISAVYTQAAIRIPSLNATHLVERDPPYITYNPEHRIMLCDTEETARQKLQVLAHLSPNCAFVKYWKAFLKLAKMFGLID